MKMRYMGASWGDFGGLWAHVGWKWWVWAPFWLDFFHFCAPRWLVDGFWAGFGGQVGAKLGPSLRQVGIKIDKKRCQKIMKQKYILKASWRHLEAILERKSQKNQTKMGPKLITFNQHEPKYPQSRPRMPPRNSFSLIFDRFLMDFQYYFHRLLLDFSLIFDPILIDASKQI